jgi:aliphatic sulfonates family ABC transporter substrate-binding protein
MPIWTLPNSDAQPLTVRAKALVFEDEASQALLDHIGQIAPSEATVLVTGETGTGKEIIARHLHDLSARRARPFVAVNCGAFSESLVESELFGHERGAFTGAHVAKAGWFESAQGGTLFLDEIGDLPLGLQVKLLRVLQEREVVRVGSRQPIPIDVRLVAATNIDLLDAVHAEKFREDLYYRLNVAPLTIPPLRARVGDIPPLAQHFIRVYGQRLEAGPVHLSPSATERLLAHPWPGNIRELENVIHRALLVCRDGRITAEDLRLPEVRAIPSPTPSARGAPNRLTGEASSNGNRTASPSANPGAAGATFGPPGAAENELERALLALFDEGRPHLHAHVEETLVRAAYRFCHRNQLQTARLLGVSRNVVRARLIQIGELAGTVRAPATVRIGYQQFGLLELVKAIGALDRGFSRRSIRIAWTPFPSGTELCAALHSGSIDLGVVGEGPPLMAHAAGGPLVYLAAEPPAPEAEAIVVRADSPIRDVRELRGRRLVLQRGANVHYFLARALAEAGVRMEEVSAEFAAPLEAAGRFRRGEVEAWVIWDPVLAAVEQSGEARVLRNATGLCANRAYYVGARAFADGHPDLVELFLEEVRAFGASANKNADAIAELLAPAVGFTREALACSLRRNHYGLRSFDREIESHQQVVADRALELKLIPGPISIAEARWTPPEAAAPIELERRHRPPASGLGLAPAVPAPPP